MTSPKPRLLVAAALLALLAGCGDADPQAGATTPPAAQPTTPPATDPPTSEPTTEAPPPAPADPKLGATQTTDLGKVTVYAVKFPVSPQDDSAARIRTKGTAFAVADIKVCSNGTTNADGYGFGIEDFQLIDTSDSAYTFWNVQIGARSPNLTDSVSGLDTPRAGSCKRGWLTFELPPKAKVKTVEYAPNGGTPLVWTVAKA